VVGEDMVEPTGSGKALVITLLFRLLFGGYLMGMDQYRFNDIESALTVFLIYGLIGIFTSLFLSGKRYGLKGIIGLDVIFIILQSVFIIVTLGQVTEAGLHDPLNNFWATILLILFTVFTLIFAIRVYRETKN
jgi:hypothetical protein